MIRLVCFLLLVPLALTACGKKTYNPYDEDENPMLPPAEYEGRQESRFVPTSIYDEQLTSRSLSIPARSGFVQTSAGSMDAGGYSEEATYLLGPGDVLEIIYQLNNVSRSEAYQVQIMDDLEISFHYTPELDSLVTVRPDGQINLPLIGDIPVAGQNTQDIREDLVTRYSEILKDPEIQVIVQRSSNAIEELKKAITTAPRGQSRLEPVRPDGFISLPLIGDVRAQGRTTPELSAAIVDMYRAANVIDIDVTVVLLEVKAPSVYVMGHVNDPGTVILEGPMNVWQVVGHAGGFAGGADTNQVVVSRKVPGGEMRHVLDFLHWQATGDPAHNLDMQRGDVVFIPKRLSEFIYVCGEVEKPGRIALEPDEVLRTSQALSLGGKILPTGKRRQVLILRRRGNEPQVIEVDIKAVLRPKNYDDIEDYTPRDPVLLPGDVVYIPASRVGNFDKFAQTHFRDGLWAVIPFNLTATYSLN